MKIRYKMIKGLLFTVLLSLLSVLWGCSPNQPNNTATAGKTEAAPEAGAKLKVLTIGTADSGGTMYPVGNAIAQVISDHDANIKVNLSASNGSFTNVEWIEDGQIDMGLVSGDVAFAAYFGTDDFSGRPVKRLRAIGAIYTSVSNWMAPESSGLVYVHDLAGKSAAIGPQGSTTDISARITIDAVGLNSGDTTLVNSGLGSGSVAVLDGTLDAVHGFAGIPISGLTELSRTVPCRVLKFTQEELREIISKNSFYYNVTIPAGTYPSQDEDVDSFGIKCLLCVDEEMDEELVYRLTKILDESIPQLSASHESLASLSQKGFICDDLSIPLHRGAERYYLEAGYLEPENLQATE